MDMQVSGGGRVYSQVQKLDRIDVQPRHHTRNENIHVFCVMANGRVSHLTGMSTLQYLKKAENLGLYSELYMSCSLQ